MSNDPGGYDLTVHRSAFTPDDLPLGLTASAPSDDQQVGEELANGHMAPIPIPPASDLLVGSSPFISGPSGDLWPTNVGFVSAIPLVHAGPHTATLTFTVVGR